MRTLGLQFTISVFFTLISWGSISQLPKGVYSKQQYDELQPAYDVVSINCEYLQSVNQLKKFELGIDLDDELSRRIDAFIHPNDTVEGIDPLNPFLEWDLKISVEFTHLESKEVKTREAFFYQNYLPDARRNDWMLPESNPYPMRVRFAPPKVGEWSAKIITKYRDVNDQIKEVTLPKFEFTVVKTDHAGYVSVHDNKKNFVRGDEVVLPIGHNLAGPYNGVQTYGGDPETTHKRAELDDWKSFQSDIHRYAKEGGKHIKLIQFPYSSLLEFENRGNYYNRLHYAWEQDKILDFCEEKDLLVHYNMMFQNPIMKFSQYGRVIYDFGHWDGLGKIDRKDPYKPYCYYTREGKEPYEMFIDSLDLEYHKQRTRYYISRFGYSPQIYNFEILSEPWHLNESYYNENYYKTGTRGGDWEVPLHEKDHPDFVKLSRALVNYHDVISTYIKEGMNHKEHLIGITIFSGGASYPWEHEDALLDSSIFLPNIDIIGVNRYDSGPDKLVISKNTANDQTPYGENSYYHLTQRLFKLCQKPVVYSEAGTLGSCNPMLSHKVDVSTLAFTGAAAVYIWAGYSYGPGLFDERKLWKNTFIAQNFINQEDVMDVLNGTWKQGRQVAPTSKRDKKATLELQYYISEEKNMAVGYFKNRSYNDVSTPAIKNCTNQTHPSWSASKPIEHEQTKKVMVKGLKSGKYLIHWYDYSSGKLIKTTSKRLFLTNKMKKMQHPKLSVSGDSPNPIVYFKIERIKKR